MGRKVLLPVALAMVLAACGDDGGEATTTTAAGSTTTSVETTTTAAAELTQVTFLSPNPSGMSVFPVCVARNQGFFGDQGLEVQYEAVDGSGAVLQALAAGQAEFGLPGPVPMMAAVERGEEYVGIFNAMPAGVFSLVVPEDSVIQAVADVRNTVVGVGTADGAEVGWVTGLLSTAGFSEGADYTLLPVGDGGQATAAFERGEIDSYAGSVVDIAIMRARGLSTRDLTPDGYKLSIGNMYATTAGIIAERPELVQDFVNAILQATVFAFDPANFDTVLADCALVSPEEAREPELAAALLRVVMQHSAIPGSNQFGLYTTAQWEFVQEAALAGGAIAAEVDLAKIFTNQFVEAAYAAGYGD
jgi:NitT/TauT family transport system substrate-binding protein